MTLTISKKKIMAVRVLGYLILISIDFYDFNSVFASVLGLLQCVCQTLKTELVRTSKHLIVRQKYFAPRLIFITVVVLKYVQTRYFVFDLSLGQQLRPPEA